METTHVIQACMAFAISVSGFLIKRILTMLDEGGRRMTQLEIELSRMKQSERDMRDTLERIEEKLDTLLLKQ
tara:strand:- start:285 stop:500 length:216 start_codon:yes stop_codon:yes gene_type:complete